MDLSLHCRNNGLFLGNIYGAGSGPIWLDDVNCIGTETQLGSCRHRGWGIHNCAHAEDVSIACMDDSTPRGWAIVCTNYGHDNNTIKVIL